VKTLLKSVHIYQSYCKKNLAQFFLAHPVDRPPMQQMAGAHPSGLRHFKRGHGATLRPRLATRPWWRWW